MQSYFAIARLNRFDQIRRQIGYSGARALLDDFATAIARALPAAADVRANRDTIEFVLRDRSEAAAQRLLAVAREEIVGEIRLRPTIGRCDVTIAAVPCFGGKLDAGVLARADRTLDRAERDGAHCLLAPCSHDEAEEALLVADLPGALRRGELCLHYQPKFDARTCDMVGSEALLRWNHPRLGAISPTRFVPLVERDDNARALTEWILHQAVGDQAAWHAAGVMLSTHVNIPAPLISDRNFVDQALSQLGPAASAVGMEITETAMISDPAGTLENLGRLAGGGVRLAIDDYGTGFSSLAYLQRLPVDELKIDRSFISRLSTGSRDPLLVRSTIDLAHALDMKVTAEGVTSAGELALLQVMRCDLVQGFLLSHPLPVAELIDLSRTATRAVPRPQSLRERLAARRAGAER